eukprot:XP_011443014.1 PREDICTED: uncharacterized protein LOC105339246 [Crassostrea gigas]
MKILLAFLLLMLTIEQTSSKHCVWYERIGYYDRFHGRVIYDVYKTTKECIKGYTCCSPGAKYCCQEYEVDDSIVTTADAEDDGKQTMGFIIGATLGVAALLFMCSMFGRKLCKRGQASSQSNENSESDQGLIASSDKEQGSIVVQSSTSLSPASSPSEDEDDDSDISSRKSLLHLHDDTKTFLSLLHARRHYPSEPPPSYNYVMNNKEKYPLRHNMLE